MITVQLHENGFVSLALQSVIQQIETEEGLDLLLRQGCPASLLDDLRQRKARDLLEVARRLRTTFVLLSIKEIEGELHRMDRIREDRELYEYFILHGANRNMVCEMWKSSKDEVASMRKSLLPDGGASPGRTPLPKDPAVREAIHQAWAEICKQHPDASYRQLLYQLHQRFMAYSIDTLVSTLEEFKEKDKPRGRRTSSVPAAEPRELPGSTDLVQRK